jgi:hypothetical protein
MKHCFFAIYYNMSFPPSAEQTACVDALLAGSNVTVVAAAGAGKSTTFYHAAKAWLVQNEPGTKVLQLCFNVVLRAEAEKRIKALNLQDHIDCFTVHALAAKMYETRVSDTLSLHLALNSNKQVVSPAIYSLCLVDEAQDLNTDHIAIINRLQTLFTMRFMVVGDMRQEIYAHAHMTAMQPLLLCPEVHLHDNKLKWQTRYLTTSYRLTPRNCAFINTLFRHATQAPILPGNTTFRDCLPIYVIGNRRNDTDLVVVVKEMLQRYPPSAIMILAPTVGTVRFRCQQLAKALSGEVAIFSTHKQRAETTAEMLKDKLFLSTFHQSKGYERPCVIVLGAEGYEWTLNSQPKIDGEPVVHNALHVACTRAQEQLVLFQHYESDPYPTLTLAKVANVAEMRLMCEPVPEKLRSPARMTIRRDAAWLTSFQPRELLLQLLGILDMPPAVVCGPEVTSVPNHVALMTTQLAEDVWDYFPEAILSAAQALLTHERTRMQAQVLQMNPKLIPASFMSMFLTLKTMACISDYKDWIALSAMHNTLVVHDYPHELTQMCDFSWCTQTDRDFFQQCVVNLTALLQPMARGHWNEKSIAKTVERYKVTLYAEARFAEWSEDGKCTPWQFNFQDAYTEADLMTAMVQMWAFSADTAKIFCVLTNRLYVIKAPPVDELNSLVHNMMAIRRNL